MTRLPSHDEIEVPYAQTGRRAQKSRTREALLQAARQLMDEIGVPTVKKVAERARVGRATAYRYFPTELDLLIAAAEPSLNRQSLLPARPTGDVTQRLDLVVRKFTDLTMSLEPVLRMILQSSLGMPPAARPPMYGGRAIGWIEEALDPLENDPDKPALAAAIRAATGIEALVCLTDEAGMSPKEAAAVMRRTARVLLEDALGSSGT